MSLENDDGLWLVMAEPGGGTLARFAIDPSELRATISGLLSFNATDGAGSSVSIDGTRGALKVRLEGQGSPAKNCRLDVNEVEQAIKSLNLGV